MGIFVPDTNTFSLQNVYDAVNDHAAPLGTLASCFINSNDSYFDSAYNNDTYAPANSMKRFRNYGQNGPTIVEIDGNVFYTKSQRLVPTWDPTEYNKLVNNPDYVVDPRANGLGFVGMQDYNSVSNGLSRTFLEFDVWATVPQGATITSVSLQFKAKIIDGFSHDIYLSRHVDSGRFESELFEDTWIQNALGLKTFTVDSSSLILFTEDMGTLFSLAPYPATTMYDFRIEDWDEGYMPGTLPPSALQAFISFASIAEFTPVLTITYE